MTVKEIVATWLKEHGYDGLYKKGSEPCGCGILCAVDDFMPCAGNVDDCKPGYIHTSKCMDCEDDCDEGDGVVLYCGHKGDEDAESE